MIEFLLILIFLLLLLGRKGFLWLLVGIILLPFFFSDPKNGELLASLLETLAGLLGTAQHVLHETIDHPFLTAGFVILLFVLGRVLPTGEAAERAGRAAGAAAARTAVGRAVGRAVVRLVDEERSSG